MELHRLAPSLSDAEPGQPRADGRTRPGRETNQGRRPFAAVDPARGKLAGDETLLLGPAPGQPGRREAADGQTKAGTHTAGAANRRWNTPAVMTGPCRRQLNERMEKRRRDDGVPGVVSTEHLHLADGRACQKGGPLKSIDSQGGSCPPPALVSAGAHPLLFSLVTPSWARAAGAMSRLAELSCLRLSRPYRRSTRHRCRHAASTIRRPGIYVGGQQGASRRPVGRSRNGGRGPPRSQLCGARTLVAASRVGTRHSRATPAASSA